MRFATLVGTGKLALLFLAGCCVGSPPHKSVTRATTAVRVSPLALPLVLPPVTNVVPRYSVTLAWDPSPSPGVVGYRIYYGTAPRDYTNQVNAGNATLLSVSNLNYGPTYYFTATAYDLAGLESDFSNEASYGNSGTTVTTISVLVAPTVAGAWRTFTNWPAIKMTNVIGTQFWKFSISQRLE